MSCKCSADIYLRAIKIMHSHLGISSTDKEKLLIKQIEKEILVVAGLEKLDEKGHSYHYYDTNRNKS